MLHFKICTSNAGLPYVLFVHGGPGSNSYLLEQLVADHSLFSNLAANLILYDQRNCGRSVGYPEAVLHSHNVEDLKSLVSHLELERGLNLTTVMGHSYGAKVAYDLASARPDLKYVLAATHDNLLRPRLNNLLLDLKYLQREEPAKYDEAVARLDPYDPDSIWELTSEFDPLFFANPDRKAFYWGNRNMMDLVSSIERTSPYPRSTPTFASVRESLYKDPSQWHISIDDLNARHCWIMGFHDFIMGGNDPDLPARGAHILAGSGHYPHIEENVRFCEIVNEFIAHE